MKINISFLFIFLFVGYYLTAQKENTFKLGANFVAFGKNNIFSSKQVDGAPGINGTGFYSFGMNFIYAPCTCSDIETGIEFSHHSVKVTPNLPPEMDNTPYSRNVELISVPANFRINLLKYFFIGGGILFDIDISNSSPINNQTGLGVHYGLGFKYDFKCGLTVYLNPYAKAHSIISFSSVRNSQKISEMGIKIGISYKIK